MRNLTVPGIDPVPCTDDYPCWILGTGYRVVQDTTYSCAIDDSYEGKVDCNSNLGVLMLCPETKTETQYIPPSVDVAAVPLGGALDYMLVCILLWAMFKYLPKWADSYNNRDEKAMNEAPYGFQLRPITGRTGPKPGY